MIAALPTPDPQGRGVDKCLVKYGEASIYLEVIPFSELDDTLRSLAIRYNGTRKWNAAGDTSQGYERGACCKGGWFDLDPRNPHVS
jgi:hypothetical protein